MAKNEQDGEGILDKVKIPSIAAEFKVNSLMMKGLKWTMEMVVEATLDKAYHFYNAVFSYNAEANEHRIQVLQEKIEEIRGDVTLFGEKDKMKQDQISLKLDEIEEIEKQMKLEKKNCPSMEFLVEVQDLHYKDGGTRLKLKVPDDVIPEINKNKFYFQLYKVELEPRSL